MFNFTENQAAAINTLHCNVSVSAGAGSGKTRVLVERFINILAQGLKNPQRAVQPKEILAITFTRKAAAEMKERIRKRLYELEKEDALNKTFWQEQRQGFDQARISTIHGFCNGILKENPVEAELDPAFNVAEENDMQEFLEESVTSFIKKALAEANAAVQTLIRAYGVAGFKTQLMAIQPRADEILAFGDLAVAYNISASDIEDKQAELIGVIGELIAGIDTTVKPSSKTHYPELLNLQENRAAVVEAVRSFEAGDKRAVLDKYIDSMAKNAKDKELVAEAQDLLNALYQTIIDAQAKELAAAWQEVIAACAEFIKARQAEQNLIGFDDLEALALKLLQGSPDIRRKYQQNFKYIMVDEFQDTNERQREIVYLLCGDDKERLAGGKLFVVGDPKQSIYRFRGADVNVFARVRRDIGAGGGSNLVLDDNFRTVDKILDLCNETFPDLLGLDETKDVFFEALKPNRTAELLPELLVVMHDAQTAQLEPKQAEACVVAQKINALHSEGVPYGDMVILLRALTSAAVYESTLKAAGIPCSVLDGKGFYARQEIIDFVNLLTVCADSRRDLELAGVLRSPYFAVDDETLTALFFKMQDDGIESLWQLLQNRSWPAYLSEGTKTQLAYCAEALQNIYSASLALPLTDLLEYIKNALNLNAVLAAQPGGEEQLANLKKLFSLAGDFCLPTQGGLREYLENIRKLRANNAREAAALLESEQQAVTIMTIHKSKGLEFPVVILPGLDAGVKKNSASINFDKNIGLGIKANINGELKESSVFAQIKALDAELENAEKQRQFYVAMTRAKDRLIMSGVTKVTKTAPKTVSWFKKLQNIWQDYEGISIEGIDAADIVMPVGQEEAGSSIKITDSVLQNTAPLAGYGKGWQQGFSASSLQQYQICPRSYYYHYVLQMPMVEPQQEGSSGMDVRTLGTLIHAALEKYNGDAHKALMQAAYNNNVPLQNLAEAKELLTGYLNSSLYPGLGAKQLHEVEFNLPLLTSYGIEAGCHGFIDCIVYNGDGSVTVIDYKTGRVPEGLPKGYEYQLALYKMAVQQMLGRPVKSAELHFLRGCVRLALPEDFEAKELAAELKELFNKTQEADFACRTDYCRTCPYSYFCKKCE